MIINNLKKKFLHAGSALCFALAIVMVLWGCATVPEETDIVARVDGEAITIEDLIYSLNVSHRLEDLSSAGELDLSAFVQRLVDELLIIQEARRMGMADDPEVRKKLEAYILRESVVRLYNDEIVDKSPVSGAEIMDRYRHDYEQFIFHMIAVSSQEEASAVMERLREGEDFLELASEHSIDYARYGGEKTLKRKEMPPVLEEAVAGLEPDGLSGIINTGDNFFYIVKLIERKKAPEEEFNHVSKNIKRQLNKIKTEQRSEEYLKELRAAADIEVDRELLDSLELDNEEDLKEHRKDKRVVARVNDNILTAGAFASGFVPAKLDSRERAVNNWIDIQVVNDEALRRQYALKAGLREEVHRYGRQLLKNIFAKKIIVPEISISRAEMEEYYDKHKEDFARPASYKIQQITVKTMEEARKALDNLKGGASFSWLAKKMSKDEFATKGGYAGWKTNDEFLGPEARVIDTLNSGEVSPVIELDGFFRIIRLQEKGDTEYEEFGAVRQLLQKRIFREKFNKIYDEYVGRLKESAKIDIYEETLEAYKSSFRK